MLGVGQRRAGQSRQDSVRLSNVGGFGSLALVGELCGHTGDIPGVRQIGAWGPVPCSDLCELTEHQLLGRTQRV